MNPNSSKEGSLSPNHPLLRGGQNAFIANPARMRIKATRWLAANPGILMLLAGVIIAGAVAAFFKPLIGISLCSSGLIVAWFIIRSARQKYLTGGVCPGVVLSVDDGLVAVFTDLKAGSAAFHPAMKIVRQPLHRFAAEEAYDGMRVAMVAEFHGSARRDVWKNISPEVIGCVVHNDELVTRAFESISEDQWEAMEVYLAKITEKSPGLYRFWSGGESISPAAAADTGAFAGWIMLKTVSGLSVCFVGMHLLLSAGAGMLTKWKNQDAVIIDPASEGSGGTVLRESESPKTGAVILPPQKHHPENGVTNVGLLAVGQQVLAYWDGRWIKASVIESVRGGAIVRVKLEDPKFRHPVLVAADQVRLQ